MQSITSVDALHEAIAMLESRRREQEQELSSHFMIIYDRLRPITIIKNTVRALVESTDVNTVIGLVAGYLSRKLFIGSASGPLKKIFGAVLQFGITTLVKKKADALNGVGLQHLPGLPVNRNRNGSRGHIVFRTEET